MSGLNTIDRISIFFVISVVVFFAVYFNLPIFSLWETTNVYLALEPVKAPDISFVINAGADTSGYWGDKGYFFLRASRIIANIWGYNLTSVRALPVIYGLLSLILLYRIMNRVLGFRGGILAVVLLATNSHFIVFQHNLLPQIFAVLSVLFCLDRYQILVEKGDKLSAYLFGLACAIAATGYLPGRIFMVVILSYYISDDLRGVNIFRHREYWKQFKVRLLSSFHVFVGMMAAFLIYPENYGLFFSKTFIFSDLGEYGTNQSDIVQNIIINFQVLMQYFFFGDSEASILSDIASNVPVPLESSLIIIFALMGIGLALCKVTEPIFRLFLLIFCVYFLALLVSMTFPERELFKATTLSNYRAFLLVPLLIFFSTIAISWGLTFYERKITRIKMSIFFFVMLIVFVSIRGERNFERLDRFNAFLNQYDFKFTENEQKPDISTLPRISSRFEDRQNIIDQVYFLKMAQYQANLFKNQDMQSQHIIPLSEERYMPTYFEGGGRLPHGGTKRSLPNYPSYFNLFSTLYLRQQGIDIGYFVQKNVIYKDRLTLIDRAKALIDKEVYIQSKNPKMKMAILPSELKCDDYKILGSGFNKPRYLLVSQFDEKPKDKCLYSK